MIVLRQATQIKVRIGPAVAVGDGFTPVTSLTLSGADEAELLKADGAATVDISGATFAAITGADGWFDLTLTTSHTDTVGELLVVVNDDSLILPIYQRFQVVEEAVYDAMFAASAPGYLQPTTAGRTLDVTATGAAGVDWGNVENPTTTVGLSGTTVKDATDVNTDTDTLLTRVVGTLATGTHNPQSGDAFSRLGAPAGASVSADVAAVKGDTAAILVDTAEIGAAGAGLTAVPWNAAWDAEAQSECADALAAYGAATAANVSAVETDTQDIQSRLPAALTAGGNMKSDALAVSGDATAADTLELFVEALDQTTGQIDNGTFAAGAIDAAAIAADAIGSSELAADAVTDIQSGLATAANLATVAGYLDTEVAAILEDTGTTLPAQIAALNNLSAAQVNAEVDAALADANLDHLVGTATGIPAIPAGTYLNQLLDDGTETFNRTTDSLQAIRDRGDNAWISGGDTGSGARTVAITVDDGTDPLENAKVRFGQGAESYVSQTDASGDVSFSLDDAMWTVSITKPGYQFPPTTLAVDGNETVTYSMDQIVMPGGAPDQTNGFLYVYDENGEPEEAAEVTCIAISASSNLTGLALDTKPRTEASDVNGLVEFSGLFKGVTYRFRRGKGASLELTIPTTATDPYELPTTIFGKP